VRELYLASRGVKFVEAIEEVIDIEPISGPGVCDLGNLDLVDLVAVPRRRKARRAFVAGGKANRRVACGHWL
jgi:hypothetical protein